LCSSNFPESIDENPWNALTQDSIKDTYKSERTAGDFKFDPEGSDPINTGSVLTYKYCIEKADDLTYATSGFKLFAKSFREQSTYDEIVSFIEFFEMEYSCAGICSPSLFSYTRDVTQGLPEKSCMVSIADEMKTTLLGVGGAALASGIFLFFTFICQYCLWRKYDDE